jgi:hypothetical protein
MQDYLLLYQKHDTWANVRVDNVSPHTITAIQKHTVLIFIMADPINC